jgi:hypothetical protein
VKGCPSAEQRPTAHRPQVEAANLRSRAGDSMGDHQQQMDFMGIEPRKISYHLVIFKHSELENHHV